MDLNRCRKKENLFTATIIPAFKRIMWVAREAKIWILRYDLMATRRSVRAYWLYTRTTKSGVRAEAKPAQIAEHRLIQNKD
jgi:hypothetical protein